MPFDGASRKHWDEDPERLQSERRWQWLFRLLWIMVGVAWFGMLAAVAWK